jgi:hypothetical protein
MRFAKEITINASPEHVYDYVADFSRHGEWGAHSLQVPAAPGPAAPGLTVQSTAQQFGTQRENLTVIDATPGKRFAFESKGGLGTVLNAFDLESAGDGATRLTKSQDFIKPSLLYRVMSWQVNSQRPKELQADLDKIKQHLEAPS